MRSLHPYNVETPSPMHAITYVWGCSLSSTPPSTPTPLAALQIDLKNAFNSVNRPAILLIGDASLAEPSGEDETLIACATPPAHALWASHGLAGISGFLEPGEIPAGCEFLGRYPRPPAIEETR